MFWVLFPFYLIFALLTLFVFLYNYKISRIVLYEGAKDITILKPKLNSEVKSDNLNEGFDMSTDKDNVPTDKNIDVKLDKIYSVYKIKITHEKTRELRFHFNNQQSPSKFETENNDLETHIVFKYGESISRFSIINPDSIKIISIDIHYYLKK